MSARHRIARAKAAMQHTPIRPVPPGFNNMQQRPVKQDVGIDQLVPMLIQAGNLPRYTIGNNAEQKLVRIDTIVGPLSAPLIFDATNARLFAEQILDECDKVDPQDEQEEDTVEVSPEAEQLLAEAIANTSGPRVESAVDTSWMHGQAQPSPGRVIQLA